MIQRLLNTEEVSYSSDLSLENLKKRIQDLFEQGALRISGKLTSENEFSVYDKLVVVGWNMPFLKRKSAYLKGKFTQEEKGTMIQLKVRPNSVFPIIAMMAAILGIVLVIVSYNQNDKLSLLLGFVFLVLGIVYYPLSTLYRNRLRNKVVTYLDLSKV